MMGKILNSWLVKDVDDKPEPIIPSISTHINKLPMR